MKTIEEEWDKVKGLFPQIEHTILRKAFMLGAVAHSTLLRDISGLAEEKHEIEVALLHNDLDTEMLVILHQTN